MAMGNMTRRSFRFWHSLTKDNGAWKIFAIYNFTGLLTGEVDFDNLADLTFLSENCAGYEYQDPADLQPKYRNRFFPQLGRIWIGLPIFLDNSSLGKVENYEQLMEDLNGHIRSLWPILKLASSKLLRERQRGFCQAFTARQ